MLQRQINQTLHGARPLDAASVCKIIEQNRNGQVHFNGSQLQARQHERNVPADFLLLNGGNLSQKLGLERLQEFWMLAGSFFNGIGGAHAKKRVWGKHGAKGLREERWGRGDFASYGVGIADGAAVAALQDA